MSCSAVSSQQYYFLNNRCLQSCPTGTIANTTPVAQCKLCSTGCATCNTFVDNCTACTSGLFLQSSTNTTKTCLQSCQDKLYADSSTMSCLPCRSPCLTCSTLSLCQSCINVTGSQEQTYYYQQSCLLTCPDTTFPNTTSLVCQNCSYPCKTCTATNCLSCISGLYMSNSHCFSNCIEGYYGDSSVGSCIACIPPCQFCSASTVCTSCQPGYSLKNGVCLNNCPKGTFTNNLTRQCSNCSANC
jgi:proprotein convertase subtilisin/kexin type 5